MRPRAWRVALVAPLVVLSLAGAACSAGTGASGGANSKSVTIAINGEPTNVDPCNDENAQALVLKNNVVQALTDLQPGTLNVIPLLADSWQQQDPTTWIFKLHPNVTFQDGTPFDATAAAFGINRALNNKKISCTDTAKIGAGITVTPSAVDPTTLKVVTNKPDPILPRELSYIDLVSPKTSADTMTDHPVGTGPYLWDAWQRGQYFQLKRWSGYTGGVPQSDIDTVKVVFRTEDSVRANMVKTGEADIAVPIAPQDATNDDRTKSFSRLSTIFYRLSVQTAPFNDIRVRQAVQYALNKQQLLDSLMQRTGTVTGQIVPKGNNGYDPNYTAPSYDVNKAKELLAEAKAAGVPVDRQITLVGQTNQFTGSDEVIQAIFQDLQKAGFNVKLQAVDAAKWKQLLFKPFPPDQGPMILQTVHKNVSGDASSSFTSYIATAGCCGTANSPQIDSLINQAQQASGDARTPLFRQAADLEYTQDISMVPIAELSELMMLSKRVNYEPSGLTGSYEMLIKDIHLTSS